MTERITAENDEYHNFIFSAAHSRMTIMVSTAIPNVTIKLKLVIKLRDKPNFLSTIKVIPKARGMESDAITDSLRPTKRSTARKTNNKVSIKFLKSDE